MIYSIGNNDPSDNFGVDPAHMDPLTRARIALDFEAMAAGAPAVKDILFQAQTMGPVAPVRELWRPKTATLALGFCLLILALPWLPQRSSFTVMQIGFEQALGRSDADKLAAHLVRQQPENVLLLTEFTPSNPLQSGYDVQGQLRVKLTAFNTRTADIEQMYRAQISNYRGQKLEPMFRVDERVEEQGFHSPALLAVDIFKHKQQQMLTLPDQTQVLAQLVTGSDKLLASALAPKIEKIANGVKLGGVSFGPAPSDGSADFSVNAWPQPMNFTVEGYDALDSDDKQRVLSAATEFVQRSNLGLQQSEQSESPLQVKVYRENGTLDSMQSRKVQAWITQVDPAGSALGRATESEIVQRAMDAAMPGLYFRASYVREGGKTIVTIQLTRDKPGLFEQGLSEAEAETEKSAGLGEL